MRKAALVVVAVVVLRASMALPSWPAHLIAAGVIWAVTCQLFPRRR